MENQEIKIENSNDNNRISKYKNENCCLFREAINKYIDLLTSQMDSFPIIINTLAVNVKTSSNRFEKFLKDRGVKLTLEEENKSVTYNVPIECIREFERLKDELSRSIEAYVLIPRNTIVAMVSLYDAFIADLLESAYVLKPQLLNACEKEFSFSEIMQFENIEKIKHHVIEKDVESILRESHIKQFEILSNRFKVELTKDLPSYNDFVEITERRNLFVHTNGRVSSQYLKVCRDRPFDHKDKDVQIGEELSATPAYVEHCYNILFEIGLKLGQVLWRKLENDLEKADDLLINIGYDLIKSKKYSLACVILDFSSKPYVKHFNKESEYVLCVNRALAYYLQDDKEKCNSIINEIDWSGADLRFRLANKVLLEQYDEASDLMKKIGNNSDIRLGYAEWPLFNNYRKTQQFKDIFKEIFGCDFEYNDTQPTEWEDVIQEAANMIKEVKDKQAKAHKDENADC